MTICELVIGDIHARARLGLERYGKPLPTGDVRTALQNAYEECLDQAIYLRQAIEAMKTSDIVTIVSPTLMVHVPPAIDDMVEQAFDAYVSIVGRSRLSKPVRDKLRARMTKVLQGYTLEELKRAWTEMSHNDFLMGDNESGKKYLHNILYALRVEKIDEYLEKAEGFAGQRMTTPAPQVLNGGVLRRPVVS